MVLSGFQITELSGRRQVAGGTASMAVSRSDKMIHHAYAISFEVFTLHRELRMRRLVPVAPNHEWLGHPAVGASCKTNQADCKEILPDVNTAHCPGRANLVECDRRGEALQCCPAVLQQSKV